ncbi:MAG: methylmalonyl-CoA mutase family protein, partial [Candidatus Binataceae bacterium]
VGGELTRLLAERQRGIASGELVQVGVNAFLDEIGLTGPGAVTDDAAHHAAAERERIESLIRWRGERDARATARALEALERATASGAGVMEPSVDLARAGGTVGEWTAAIERATNGRYTPPVLDRTMALAPLNVPHAPRRIRIALGKAGLDGHINAVKLLAHACMQAGMEVILAGFKQTPAQMVETALQEDAEVLAISSLAGAHLAIARETIALLKERGAEDVRLVMGGIIPNRDRQALIDMGVRAVFTPKDSDLGEIMRRIIEICDGATV